MQVQGTINGYGERTGNCNLTTIIPNLTLKMGIETIPADRLERLTPVAHHVAELVNMALNPQAAYVGESAFAHKAGLHVSAIAKRPDAYEHVPPDSVGNGTRFVVSELAGQVDDPAQGEGARPRARRPAGQRRRRHAEADGARGLPLRGGRRVARAAHAPRHRLGAAAGSTSSRSGSSPTTWCRPATYRASPAAGVSTEATIKVHVGGERVVATAEGNGPVNALDAALRDGARRPATRRSTACTSPTTRCASSTPQKGTGAVTRVLIDTTNGDRTWTTIGVSENIIEASWQALYDSLVYGLLHARWLSAARERRSRTSIPACRPIRSSPPSSTSDPAQAPNLAPGRRDCRRRARWRADRPGDLVDDGSAARARCSARRARTSATRCALVHRAQRRRSRWRRTSTSTTRAAVVGELAMKRAASFGRAPVARRRRVRRARARLPGRLPTPDVRRRGAPTRCSGAHHDYGRRRALVDAVPLDGAAHSHPERSRSRVDELRPRAPSGLARRTAADDPASSCRHEHEELRKRAAALRRERDRAARGRGRRALASTPGRRSRRTATPGFIRLPYPEEHGGDGGDRVAYAMLVEEVARVCASSSLFVLISRLACEPILAARQRRSSQQRVVPKVVDGGVAGRATASRSPHAGSDVASMTTRAVRDGDHYVLNGREVVDHQRRGLRLLHRVRQDRPRRRAPRDQRVRRGGATRPGFSVGEARVEDGDARLADGGDPARRRAGPGREPHRRGGCGASRTRWGRSTARARSSARRRSGIAQGALDAADALRHRAPAVRPARSPSFQGVQFMLADMATQVEAARLLVYRACALARRRRCRALARRRRWRSSSPATPRCR